MATASVEIGTHDQKNQGGSSINGRCLYQEALTVSSSTATMSSAVTAAQVALGGVIARISTDTACYIAIGTTPDPTATAVSGAVTSARRLIQAGASLEQPVNVGDKVAVKALS